MSVSRVRVLITLLTAMVLSAMPLFAQTGSLSGKISTASGEVIPFADVYVLSINRASRADESGQYQVSDLPAGTYEVQVSTDSWGNKLIDVTIVAGEGTVLDIVFDIQIHEDFVVSATPERKSISDIAQAVSVFNEQDLLEKAEPTIGATLGKEPGIHTSYFGPGAGRPIIRGLGGDRIRVLEGGLGNGDASTVSADHAISADTLTTQRIEILRGPAALRYGSNAVGGAINIIDNRIPEFLPEKPFAGEVELRANSVADERAGAILINGGIKDFAWHIDYSKRDTDNYDIPGRPNLEEEEHEEEEEGHEEEPFTGSLENSDLDTEKSAAGFSIIKDRGFFGVSYTQFDTNYGISGEGHGHGEEEGHEEDEHEEEEEGHEEEEEEVIRIDLTQKRFDFRAGLQLGSETFTDVNFRYGQTDYDHTELEGEETGTVFFNESEEARLELIQGGLGPFTSGSIGLHYKHRDFEAIGEEAFVPPNKTENWALFLYEEIERDTWNLSMGLRADNQSSDGSFLEHHHEEEEEEHEEEEHEEEEGEEAELISRDDDTLSASLGFVALKTSPVSLAVNLTHTERAPTPEELFSNGPHLATQSFEVGNPELKTESSLGANVSLRRTEGRVTGEINVFTNRFDDFIYQRNTGEEEDGLPEFEFAQQDADFHGGEVHLDIELLHTDPHHLQLELMADLVRAELDNGENLPRISPTRYRADLAYNQDFFWARASATRTQSQDRTAPLETATEGFTTVDVSAGYRFFTSGLVHQLLFRGTNLTDEEARVHTSFLKDQILLPGRNFSLIYRLQF